MFLGHENKTTKQKVPLAPAPESTGQYVRDLMAGSNTNGVAVNITKRCQTLATHHLPCTNDGLAVADMLEL